VATLLNHLIACSVGEWAGKLITPQLLRWVLGISFLPFAGWALIPEKMDREVKTRRSLRGVRLTAMTFFPRRNGRQDPIVALALAASSTI